MSKTKTSPSRRFAEVNIGSKAGKRSESRPDGTVDLRRVQANGEWREWADVDGLLPPLDRQPQIVLPTRPGVHQGIFKFHDALGLVAVNPNNQISRLFPGRWPLPPRDQVQGQAAPTVQLIGEISDRVKPAVVLIAGIGSSSNPRRRQTVENAPETGNPDRQHCRSSNRSGNTPGGQGTVRGQCRIADDVAHLPARQVMLLDDRIR